MTYYKENNSYVTTSGIQDTGALMDILRATSEDKITFTVDYPFKDELNEIMTRKVEYEKPRKPLNLGP